MIEAQGHSPRTTVDPAEVARFAAQADMWWDERGPMRMLHRLNPLRLGYIRGQIVERFQRDPRRLESLSGLTILDIGCGGGVLAEPLARQGASVTAIDPAPENIEAARRHAEATEVTVDYRCETAENVRDAHGTFDVVLAMEVVEHVADVEAFVACAAAMVKPGGLMIAATINRTLKSFALAIVAAEYVLGRLRCGWRRSSTNCPASLSAWTGRWRR